MVGGMVLAVLTALVLALSPLTGFRVYIDNVRLAVTLDAGARKTLLPPKPAGTYLIDVSAVYADGIESARIGGFWVVTAATAALQWQVEWVYDAPTQTLRPAGKPTIINSVPQPLCPKITPGVGQIIGPGGTWTLTPDTLTRLNGAWVGNGRGTVMLLAPTGEIQVLGTDGAWWRWAAGVWIKTNAGPAC